jgi:hypothetical protein
MPDPLPSANADAIWRLLQWVLTAAAGALLTLVAFRTRFVVIEKGLVDRKAELDREAAERKAEFERMETELLARVSAVDRRSLVILQIVADIAKKVGVDQRMSDTLLKFMSDELGPQKRGD